MGHQHHLQEALQRMVIRGFETQFKEVFQFQVLDDTRQTVPLPVFGSGDPRLVDLPVHFIVTTNHPFKNKKIAHMAHMTLESGTVFTRFDVDGRLHTLRVDLHTGESELTTHPKQKLSFPRYGKASLSPLKVEHIDLGYVF